MRVHVLIACVLLSLCYGCSQAGSDTTGTSLGGGRVEADFALPVAELADQTRATLLDQERLLSQYSANSQSGRLTAYTRQGNRIEVDIAPSAGGSHLVVTTTGNSGDQISMDLIRGLGKGK